MEKVTCGENRLASVLAAMVLVLCISLGGSLAGNRFAESRFFQQSRIIRSIVAQDSIGVKDFLRDKDSLNAMLKFAGAVTNAYVSFELIPIHEAKTFTVIFESMENGISLDGFVYHGRDLTITGSSPHTDAYSGFVEKLESHNYFQSVLGRAYTTHDNTVRFSIVCYAKANDQLASIPLPSLPS